MSWTFAEERPIYWEEPPEQVAITNVETGEWDAYMLTSAATKRIRKLKDEVNWLHVELEEAESTCDDCHAISELRDLRDEVNWLNAELHGAELEAARAYSERGAVAMTEGNMAAHGWVRERTCEFVSRDRPPCGFIWVCSNCGTPTTGYGHLDWLYCPECGAKVVKE